MRMSLLTQPEPEPRQVVVRLSEDLAPTRKIPFHCRFCLSDAPQIEISRW